MFPIRFFVFLLFVFGSLSSTAQKIQVKNQGAIIQTFDGSVFIGSIVQETNTKLHFTILTGDTITLNKGLIRKIRKTSENILMHSRAKFHYTKGVFVNIQSGFGLDDNGSGQIDMTLGYRLNKRYSVGLGIGLSYYSTIFGGRWIETNSIPLFSYGRYYPLDSKVRPYVDLRLGWGFPNRNAFGSDHNGGVLMQPGIGIHFASKKNLRFLLSLSQVLQHTRGDDFFIDPLGNPVSSDFSIWYNRTILKVGLEWR